MKKNKILFTSFLVMLFIGVTSLNAEPECENKIEENGTIITVTVCKRKTSWYQSLVGISCGTTDESSCSFTNISPQ